MARRTRHTVDPCREVHVTGRQVFKRCRLKYMFASVQGLRPRGARNLNLAMGVAFHEGCAHLMEGFQKLEYPSGAYWVEHAGAGPMNSGELGRLKLAAYNVLLKSWNEEFPRQIIIDEYGDAEKWETSVQLLTSMFNMYADKLIAEPFWDEVVAVEIPIKRKFKVADRYVTLQGTLDVVIRDRQGLLWLVDHKTAGQFRDEDELMLDDQMTSYIMLGEYHFKEKLGGAIYSQIRKKFPAEPELLKDGSRLSKQIKDTTYESYMAAIKRHGFNPADYAEILEQCKHNEFVRHTYVPRYQSRLDQYMKYLKYELDDMTHPARQFYPSPSWDCPRFCDYYLLCRLRQEGGDEDILREQLFDQIAGGGKIYRR